METERLIEVLEQDLQPVRRMPGPWRLLVQWLALSLPVLAAITLAMGPRPDLDAVLATPGFLLAEGLAVLTALVAAYAAFCAGRPDQPGWKLLLPVALAAVWLIELGRQCLLLSAANVAGALVLHVDFACVPGIALSGLVPAVGMALLLRSSASFRLTAASLSGALAAAALAEAALRLFHAEPTFLTMLVWQMGSVALFTLAGGTIGRAALAGGRRTPAAA